VTQEKFLKLLFEPGELTCFAASPYDTHLSAQPAENSQYFSINPMHTSRADANVTAYRNFLIELDTVPLQEQVALVTARIPVSSIVFSGNKSYHFIVSLAEPVTSAEEYSRTFRGLLEAVPEADKSTKNPSRLSRLPGVFRPDTRLLQELLYLGRRIPLAELPKPKALVESESTQPVEVKFVSNLLQQALNNPDDYIAAHFSGRNQFFYWVGKRCTELKQTRAEKKQLVDRMYDKLQAKKGFTRNEAYAAARVKF
jgi:hypothetical protein